MSRTLQRKRARQAKADARAWLVANRDKWARWQYNPPQNVPLDQFKAACNQARQMVAWLDKQISLFDAREEARQNKESNKKPKGL